MSDLSTFALSDIIELIGAAAVPRGAGLNVSCENIDDEVFGCVVSTEKSFAQFLQQHRGPYNFQAFDRASTIIVRRTLVDDDLAIDLETTEAKCIRRNEGPSVQFIRIDPASLPRAIEIQYIDPDRAYAINTQTATYHAAPKTNGPLSVPIDFVLSADQARGLAFDYLYRLWAQQVGLIFEHPDSRIEPGDVISITAGSRMFTVLVQESTLTHDRTSMVKATALLASRGITIAGGASSSAATGPVDELAAFIYT